MNGKIRIRAEKSNSEAAEERLKEHRRGALGMIAEDRHRDVRRTPQNSTD
jgi:hypothetical protein